MTLLAGAPGDVYDAHVWTGDDPGLLVVPPPHSVSFALASTTTPGGTVAAHHIVSAKLSQLLQLKDGWLGSGSLAPTVGAFGHYVQFLGTLGAAISLDAEAVASGEGTLQVEWETDGGVERLIEFSDQGAWLYESCNGENSQATVEPFDVQRVLSFFHGQSL